MCRRRFFGAACLIVLAVAPLFLEVRAQSPAQVTPQPASVEQFLRSQMQRRAIPGLQVAVVLHGKIVLLGAYGLANVEHSVPVTNQTVFPINSITKAFTGVAIMQLVEAGKLDLAAPVSRYLDGLPVAWQAVTIRQLLTHTSGIPNIMDDDAKLVAEGGEDAAWAKVQSMPIEYAPGEHFHYNQTNYLLVGRIIDRLSGQPFTRFITDRQFNVVGMGRTAQTGFVDSHDVVPNSARSYTLVGPGKLGNIFEEFPPSLRTAAGIDSTAEEMARWVVALQKGRLFKETSSLTTLWTPGVLNDGTQGGFSRLLNGYALGWPTMTRPEHRAVGGVGGGRSAFFIYPDDDLAVVILTNLRGASPESFVDEVAGYYIPAMRASTGFGLPPAIKVLRAELMKRGFGHALEVVNEMKARDAKFDLREEDVNAWGYGVMELGETKDAVEIFKLNVSLYPESWNAYDSLAEAYQAIGDRASAILNYRRSLELNSQNANAMDRLKTLDPDGSGNRAR